MKARSPGSRPAQGAAEVRPVTGQPPGSHLCPARHCRARVPADKLMCPVHWAKVPRPMREAVWSTWRKGGGGTRAHAAAVRAAIAAVTRQEKTR